MPESTKVLTSSPLHTPTPTPHPPHLTHHQSSGKFGPDGHLVYHEGSGEPEKPTRLRELVRKPTIRQWIDGGKLHREPSPREVPRMELFFDLLFVGIIHQLAESAIEEPSGDAVARFILTFWPSWSIWEEARRYSNVSGTDDLLHRVWILVGMMCILGYSANASAIELHPAEDELHLDSTAVHAAVSFWLIIKLTRVLVLFVYSWRLPQFRLPQFLAGLAVLFPMFVYLPLVWVTDRTAQVILATLGICADLMRIDIIFFNIAGRWLNWRRRRDQLRRVQLGELRAEDVDPASTHLLQMVKLPEGFRIPALNIEHSIERSSAFVVIVLGELVMNLLYTAGAGQFGASLTYGKAVLGLMVAWALNWIYMLPAEDLNEYEHALRRSWLTGIMFTFFHWPLCASLVLASAASGKMVANDEVENGVKWYWGAGLGFAVLFMALIELCHRNLHPMRAARIPRPIRFSLSVAGALALILFPLSSDRLSSIAMLAIGVGITWFILAFNVVGILPSKWSPPTRPGSDESGTLAPSSNGGDRGDRGGDEGENMFSAEPAEAETFREAIEEELSVAART